MDYGIKISLPGVNIETASDTQLLFSSSWPSIKIFKNVHIQQVIPAHSTGAIKLYSHNLGFVPAVIPYGGIAGTNTSNGVADISRQNTSADTSNVYILVSNNTLPINLDIRISILYLDITTPFKAPTINTGASGISTPDSDLGFKLSKDNKDIKSTDLRDFLIHSSARSPMIHAVVPGTIPASGTFSYTHDLPYNPIFFAFFQTSNTYVLINGYAGLSTSGSTISITAATGSLVSIVILKDPFQITDSLINVSL